MASLDQLDLLFIVWAFFFQLVLVGHFALRKWRFPLALRYGPLVYALGLPAAAVSLILLLGGKPWALWLGGLICLAWAIFGYTVEYVRHIEWRDPPRWPVFVPYLTLYLATIMFYWWPLGIYGRPLWLAYAILFLISTALNLSSHKSPQGRARQA